MSVGRYGDRLGGELRRRRRLGSVGRGFGAFIAPTPYDEDGEQKAEDGEDDERDDDGDERQVRFRVGAHADVPVVEKGKAQLHARHVGALAALPDAVQVVLLALDAGEAGRQVARIEQRMRAAFADAPSGVCSRPHRVDGV